MRSVIAWFCPPFTPGKIYRVALALHVSCATDINGHHSSLRIEPFGRPHATFTSELHSCSRINFPLASFLSCLSETICQFDNFGLPLVFVGLTLRDSGAYCVMSICLPPPHPDVAFYLFLGFVQHSATVPVLHIVREWD